MDIYIKNKNVIYKYKIIYDIYLFKYLSKTKLNY